MPSMRDDLAVRRHAVGAQVGRAAHQETVLLQPPRQRALLDHRPADQRELGLDQIGPQRLRLEEVGQEPEGGADLLERFPRCPRRPDPSRCRSLEGHSLHAPTPGHNPPAAAARNRESFCRVRAVQSVSGQPREGPTCTTARRSGGSCRTGGEPARRAHASRAGAATSPPAGRAACSTTPSVERSRSSAISAASRSPRVRLRAAVRADSGRGPRGEPRAERTPPRSDPTSPSRALSDEAGRLAAPRELRDPGLGPESGFDDLVALAARICDAPMAAISLVESDRQWFKARSGPRGSPRPRGDIAFCAHAILGPVDGVPDARRDARFASNPLVTGEARDPLLRGRAPLHGAVRARLGDVVHPRPGAARALSEQAAALETLSREVVSRLGAARARARVSRRRSEDAARAGRRCGRARSSRRG
jgi:hypothetical protein